MHIWKSDIYITSLCKIVEKIPFKEGCFLVTGATGLIGSSFIDALIMANKYYGKDFRIFAHGRNEKKLAGRFPYPNINFICGDICEKIDITGVDFILHAASNSDPVTYALHPVQTLLTTVHGTQNVLECARKNHARIVFTSSFEVYGKTHQKRIAENNYGLIDFNAIRSCYPEGKRTAELLLRTYHKEYNLDCVITRLCSVYGPSMAETDSKAHAQFLKKAVLHKDIVLKSKGDQIRTYCYVNDVVNALFTVFAYGQSGEVYNIANKNSVTSIANLANVIANLVNVNVTLDQPNEIEKMGYSVPVNCVLSSKKMESLGWRGEYDLQSGLKETMNILKQIM